MGNSPSGTKAKAVKTRKSNIANDAKAMFVKTLSNHEDTGLEDKMEKMGLEDKPGKKGYKLKMTKPSKKKAVKERTIENETETEQETQAPHTAYPSKKWSTEQDAALRIAVEHYQGKNWKAIAEAVPGRTHVQCLQRWKKVLQPGLVKGHWTEEEDQKLIELVTKPGKNLNSWVAIAAHIPGRTAKQCRERWSLNLDPDIKKGPWEEGEDELLLELHEKLGNKWAEISQYMNGRTENAVKTRYKSLARAQQKIWTPDEDNIIVESKRHANNRWVSIANRLPGRSKNAVRLRWKFLVSQNPDLEKPLTKEEKAAIAARAAKAKSKEQQARAAPLATQAQAVKIKTEQAPQHPAPVLHQEQQVHYVQRQQQQHTWQQQPVMQTSEGYEHAQYQQQYQQPYYYPPQQQHEFMSHGQEHLPMPGTSAGSGLDMLDMNYTDLIFDSSSPPEESTIMGHMGSPHDNHSEGSRNSNMESTHANFNAHLDPSKNTINRVPSRLANSDSVSRLLDDSSMYKPLEHRKGSLTAFSSHDNFMLMDALGHSNYAVHHQHHSQEDLTVV
uniref:Uncharacterized protein n=2 Tax=Sar TaxID=2698737 RepID=A0A7S2TCJ0_PROMC|mmetsp:Transcript_30265/g.48154  ORF Transcript_30265/g.48154 Transcript_30265/m.48154 type:complete len:556 (-) Transcript_30265:1283-2950(-)